MHTSLESLVGRTPLLKLERFSKSLGLSGNLYAKCEFLNPTGSMKDRVALAMIRDAEKSGRLRPGGTIIEPTSGNTGIGLAAFGVRMGYRVIIVMPESMSLERRQLMTLYGAELVLTPASEGMAGANRKAFALADEMNNAIVADQFNNPANARAHYDTTAPEIFNELGVNVDALVAGVGTGGSLTGVGQYYREKNPSLRIIAVEPDASAVLSGEKSGPHTIQGIGAGFVPAVLDRDLLDEVYRADHEEAVAYFRRLLDTEGMFCGISSGAALAATVDWMNRHPEQTVVTILPDQGSRYLTSDWISSND